MSVFTIQEMDNAGKLIKEFPNLENDYAIAMVAEIRERGNFPAVKNTPGVTYQMATSVLARR